MHTDGTSECSGNAMCNKIYIFVSTVVVRDPLVPLNDFSCKEWLKDVCKWAFRRLRIIFVDNMWLDRRLQKPFNTEEAARLEKNRTTLTKRLIEVVTSYGSVYQALKEANVLIPEEVLMSIQDEVQAAVEAYPGGPDDWINNFHSVLEMGLKVLNTEMQEKTVCVIIKT